MVNASISQVASMPRERLSGRIPVAPTTLESSAKKSSAALKVSGWIRVSASTNASKSPTATAAPPFRTAPILRNVALTPPYFSWGGYPDLRQVLKFYNRGGNRRDIVGIEAEAAGVSCTKGDNMGTGPIGNTPFGQIKVGTGTETNCDSSSCAGSTWPWVC